MAFSLGSIVQQGAIPAPDQLALIAKALAPASTSLASAGAADTLSAQQILSGLFVRSGATAAVTATTDTAANIVAAIPNAYVGQTFLLFYANLNTTAGAVTLAAGTGVTLNGTLTVPIAGLRVLQGVVTAVGASPAVVINSLFSIGSGVAA